MKSPGHSTKGVDTFVQIAEIPVYHNQAGESAMYCTYCAAPATDQHHVVPVDCVKPGLDKKQRQRETKRGWRVATCRECNMILGVKMFPNPQDGTAHVARRLKRNHWRLLKGKKWTESEIEASGIKGALKEKILRDMAKRSEIEARIAYAEKQARVERACANCRLTFAPNQPFQRFCVDRCRAAYHRKRKAELVKVQIKDRTRKGDCWATGYPS